MSNGENLVQTLKDALQAAELELRGVPAVASVHTQVYQAIKEAEEWQHRMDDDYYREEGQYRMHHPE